MVPASFCPSPHPALHLAPPPHAACPQHPPRSHSHGQHLHFQDFVPQLQASRGVVFQRALVKFKVPGNQQGQRLPCREAGLTVGGLSGLLLGKVGGYPGQTNRANQPHPADDLGGGSRTTGASSSTHSNPNTPGASAFPGV